jgi:serpin B
VRFLDNGELQAVELPYKGNQLAMVILLPSKSRACDQLESRLSADFLAATLKQLRAQEVEILIPRFKMEFALNLRDCLAKMGVTDAFSEEADFSGMDGTRNLFISSVFHKAWVEVTEEGTKAAAATSPVADTVSAAPRPPPRPVFRADHPCIFLLRDTRSGSVLFLGRLADPTKS